MHDNLLQQASMAMLLVIDFYLFGSHSFKVRPPEAVSKSDEFKY